MMREGNYEPQFPLELMLKDLDLAAICAEEEGQPLQMIEAARSLFAKANEAGLGREDLAAVYKAV